MPKPKSVTELFSAELKELKIAPNKTAAKKPTNTTGRTFFTSNGYASSGLVSASPNIWKAIIPGRTTIRGPSIFNTAA